MIELLENYDPETEIVLDGVGIKDVRSLADYYDGYPSFFDEDGKSFNWKSKTSNGSKLNLISWSIEDHIWDLLEEYLIKKNGEMVYELEHMPTFEWVKSFIKTEKNDKKLNDIINKVMNEFCE